MSSKNDKAATTQFLTALSAELKEGSDKIWIVNKPLKYYSVILQQLIVIPPGFETDLASVPRLPIVYSIWGAKAHREAVLHDYLFRSDSKPVVTFMQANRLFLEAMHATNKPWYISYPMYSAVVIGSRGLFHRRKVTDKL